MLYINHPGKRKVIGTEEIISNNYKKDKLFLKQEIQKLNNIPETDINYLTKEKCFLH